MSDKDGDPKENQGPGFKFVDRRRFDEEGEERHQEAPQVKEAPTASHEMKDDFVEEANSDPTLGPITFSLFIQSLAHQTLMSMGVIPWPDTGEVAVNLDHARETIDILTILHEKTKGNLTPSEHNFFESVLYELRVTFLKLVQGGTP